VVNPGAAALSDGEVTLSNLSEGLTLPDGATASVPSIPAFGSVEVTFPVALAATTEIVDGSVDVAVTAESSCEDSAAAALVTRFNFNVVPNASFIDDVESEATAWTLGGAGAAVWSREVRQSGNHFWHGDNPGSQSDSQMVSPEVTVGDAAPLVLSFTHRYSFEPSWDGGVIEYTTDGGTTWQDIADLGVDPGYTEVLIPDSGNPLADRLAYTAESAGYPTRQDVSFDLGTSLAGQTVQVRFRIGSDGFIGAPGWDIDDIGFEGIVDPPFPATVPDEECEGVPLPDAGPGGPDGGEGAPDGGGGGGGGGDGGDGGDGDDGCGCRAGDGSPSATGLLLLLALVPLRRRRRPG
jgi:MYXO-CTERM domain-containing protein